MQAFKPIVVACVASLFIAAPALALNPKNLTFTGSGGLVAEPEDGCSETEEGCGFAAEGTVNGQGIGNGDFLLTLAGEDPGLAGDEAVCFATQGDMIVTAANGGEVVLYHTGNVCTVPQAEDDLAPAPLIYGGTFTVLEGSKNLSNVDAVGPISVRIGSGGEVLVHLTGAFE